MSARRRGRELGGTLVLGLVAGAVLLWASGRPWATLAGSGVSGRQLTELPYALGLVGLAGTVAVLAAGRWLRPVVGALLVLAGAGAAVASTQAWRHPRAADVGTVSTHPLARTSHLATTGWPAVALAAAVLLAVAGGLVLWRGARWPGMGRRYEAPGARRPPPRDPVAAAWEALDRGEDPTVATSAEDDGAGRSGPGG